MIKLNRSHAKGLSCLEIFYDIKRFEEEKKI